jgi:hypothetical protein
LPGGEAVAFGVVVSADHVNGTYSVEVVDPTSGRSEVLEVPYERLRVTRGSSSE